MAMRNPNAIGPHTIQRHQFIRALLSWKMAGSPELATCMNGLRSVPRFTLGRPAGPSRVMLCRLARQHDPEALGDVGAVLVENPQALARALALEVGTLRVTLPRRLVGTVVEEPTRVRLQLRPQLGGVRLGLGVPRVGTVRSLGLASTAHHAPAEGGDQLLGHDASVGDLALQSEGGEDGALCVVHGLGDGALTVGTVDGDISLDSGVGGGGLVLRESVCLADLSLEA